MRSSWSVGTCVHYYEDMRIDSGKESRLFGMVVGIGVTGALNDCDIMRGLRREKGEERKV